MTRPKVRWAVLLAALLAAKPLGAQTLPGVVPGDTVRVIGVDPQVRGVFVAVRDDSVFVRNYSHTVGVPLERIERVDVRRKRPILEGIARGVAIGAPAGLATGYVFGRASEGGRDSCADDCGLITSIMSVAGLVAGTGLGLIFGAAVPGKRWEQVSMRPAVTAAAGPAVGGGVALGINVKL
ncbi:MAG TPA: hypothetical protein VJT67_03830 [Longimicrobiaceae bacterium]|nr:hypothetical protein [Longimicrobiaceae bacterium]